MKKTMFTLLMLVLGLSAAMAQRSISGTVVDAKSEPLIGASVLIQGTSSGTVTDVNGAFQLNVPEGSVLVISYTGYVTRTVELGASNTVSVVLESDQKVLDEVIVTAMGITRSERSLSYGVSQVGGDDIVKSGEVNAIQGLAAKAPGVQIIGSGGTPGASSKILIRGNRSFTGNNQPLIIVDGIPYDNATNTSVARDYPFNPNLQGVNNSNRALDLNPNDIESVNLLKGPAATALYGSRAANGVLQITTKKGSKSKDRFNVSFNSSIDIAQVNKLPKLQTKYAQGTGGGVADANNPGTIKDQGNFVTYVPGVSNGTASSWGPLIGSGDPRYARSFDNYDNFFRTGYTYDNGISFAGGNDITNFRVSYGNTSQSGIVPNTKLNRNSVRINAQTGTATFKVTGGVAYANTSGLKGQNGSNLSGAMLALTRMPSSFDILGGTGENKYTEADGSQHRFIVNYDNPLWSAENNEYRDVVNRLTGNIGLQYTPNPWFSVSYKLGADNYNTQVKQNWAIGSNNTNPFGEIQENTINWLEINSDLVFSFKKNLGDKFDLGLNLGNNLNVRQSKDLYTRGSNLTIPNFYNLSNASVFYASEFSQERRIAGLFGDLSIGFMDMLFLNAAARHDWASTFGKTNRENGFFYPSLGLSFIFTELLPKNDILTYGKLRASISRAGNEPSPYNTRTYYTQPFFTDGFTDGLGLPYNGNTGFGLGATLGDSELSPEITTAFELGTELKFMNNRFGLDLTYYNQKSEDLLLFRPVASSSGFSQIFTNAGAMRNTGFEIGLNADIIRGNKISWNVGINWAKNVNEVLSLADGVDEIDIESAFASIGSFAIVGQPYGALYGTKWERDANGSLIFGANGRPKIAAERGNLGNPYPDWLMGITSGLNVYGVNLSILFDIRQGGVLWGGTYARLNNIGMTEESANRSQFYPVSGVNEAGEPITVEMTPDTYFRYFKGDNGGATENSVYDGSWLRLRELSLSYDFSIKKYINTLTVFATGRNLWLKTDYPGVDPETSLTGAGSNVGGFDYFNMPGTKSYQFGIRVGF